MAEPILVELEDWVRATLETEGREQGISLEAYLPGLASLEAQAFREAAGTPATVHDKP